MAWRELKKEGIDPDKDFSELFFTQTHDAVVNAVLSGIADAGTVRTDTLEEMVREGSLDLKKIKIINPKKYSNFPLLISTPLYPEWPLAKLSGTPMQLAKEVAEVLFSMKAESNCSIESGIGGWTIAADYKPVHDALRELNIGPYKDKSFSIEDVLEKYWEFFIIIILVVIVILTSYIYLLRVQKITNKANKKIQELNKTLEDKVEERTKELNEINKTLEERVAQEVLKNRKKDEAILLQSRYAAMGEMLSMLAHQWRQPIAIIQMGVNNLILDMELGIDNVDDFKKELLVITNETEKLSNIIDDFSSKFKDDSTQQKIKPQNIMEEVLNVLEANLKYHKITIKKRYTNSSELTLIARQLFQVYLNLINNAKEVLIERNISFAKIIIVIEESAEEVVSHICDNGGGIEESNIQRIFEPYFSTKSEKNGCGLGLYICKTIVEKQLGGTISVKNSNTNACFTIRIPKKKANSEMS
jgi:C4-dicarboxylate-specific signal transduction histidine kinase